MTIQFLQPDIAGRAASMPEGCSQPEMKLQLLLAYVHDTGHEPMHGTDVAEVAFAVERMLEFVVRIQAFRTKALVGAGHRMWTSVMIGPYDLGAGCNRDLLRRERELRNVEIDCRRGCGRRYEDRRHCEGCAEDQRESSAGKKWANGIAREYMAHGILLVGRKVAKSGLMLSRLCPRWTVERR